MKKVLIVAAAGLMSLTACNPWTPNAMEETANNPGPPINPPTSPITVDLSPESWPADVRAAAEAAEARGLSPQTSQVYVGEQGAISGTASAISVAAGLETLKRGGNAADAATAIAMTGVATQIGSIVRSSLWPLSASSPMSASGSPSTTIRSACAPGAMQPSLPSCIRISAAMDVVCRKISIGENTSRRMENSRHC